jgi:hypothetical protein
MGLFAEALRQKSHDEEVAQLVNSINGSVDALEGLFSELLDITRIDSGHIEAAQAFRSATSCASCGCTGADGVRKGPGAAPLAAAAMSPHAVRCWWAHLRNLVSNAIATDGNSVLVSCRRRGGVLRLQVWVCRAGHSHYDSRASSRVTRCGHGAPSPQQHKGLGLGLAIVKRLADLMDARLTLRSQPGHGTVLTLTLPVGKVVRPAVAAPRRAIGLTLDGRLVVVVGTAGGAQRTGVLLRGKGATIASCDSVAASTAWPRREARHQRGPADRRLPAGKRRTARCARCPALTLRRSARPSWSLAAR